MAKGASAAAKAGTQRTGGSKRPADTDLFQELHAQAKRGLRPHELIDAVASTYERIMPELQAQMRQRLAERLDAQPMNPDMKLLVQRLNEDLVGNMFAKAATVMRTKHLNRMRGIEPDPDDIDADPEAPSEPSADKTEKDP